MKIVFYKRKRRDFLKKCVKCKAIRAHYPYKDFIECFGCDLRTYLKNKK